MRKTISSGIDRRAVYKFKCSGPCQRVKYTYVYERAKKGCCLTCSKNVIDQNQGSLFMGVDLAGNKDDSVMVMRDSSGSMREIRGVEHLAKNIYLDVFTGKEIDLSSMEEVN